MNWVFYALLSPLLWSINNHTDKYLVDNFYQKTRAGSLMIYASIVSFVLCMSIGIFYPHSLTIPVKSALLVIMAGFIYFLAAFPYFYALKHEEASRVVPLFQLIPLITFIFAYTILGEHLSIGQIFAGLILLGGSVYISLDLDSGFSLKKKVFWPMILTCIFFALEGVLFKFVGRDVGLWPTLFYQCMGVAIAGLLLFSFSTGYRTDFLKIFKKNKAKIVPLSFLNETINVVARVSFNYATLLAPITVVTLINGFQPVFVLTIGVFLSVYLPKFGEESLLKSHMIQKIVGIITIFIGTALLIYIK